MTHRPLFDFLFSLSSSLRISSSSLSFCVTSLLTYTRSDASLLVFICLTFCNIVSFVSSFLTLILSGRGLLRYLPSLNTFVTSFSSPASNPVDFNTFITRFTSCSLFSSIVSFPLSGMFTMTELSILLSCPSFSSMAVFTSFLTTSCIILWSLSLGQYPDSAFMSLSPKLRTIIIISSIFISSPLVVDFFCRQCGRNHPTESSGQTR